MRLVRLSKFKLMNVFIFISAQDLLKTLYVDAELSFLKDQDLAAGGSADKGDSTYDGRNGVRCIRISPDGKHMASGDRAGNIR